MWIIIIFLLCTDLSGNRKFFFLRGRLIIVTLLEHFKPVPSIKFWHIFDYPLKN